MSTQVKVEGDRLRITRVFAAPRDLVYGAWTDADRIAEWSGCAEATSLDAEMDFRVGGGYRHTIEIEEVGEMTMVGTYREIVEGRRIVYTLDWEGMESIPTTTVSVEFSDVEGGTEVRLVHDGLVTPEMREAVPGGWTAALDRLASGEWAGA